MHIAYHLSPDAATAIAVGGLLAAVDRDLTLIAANSSWLAEFEALAVEHNVVEWVLAKAKVTDVPTTLLT